MSCSSSAEQQNPPQVVTPAQDEIGLGVESGAHLAQATVTAGTLEAVLMPVLVQCLQQVSVLDLAVAACTALLLPLRLDGEHRHTWDGKIRQMSLGLPWSSGAPPTSREGGQYVFLFTVTSK